jgi:TonB family protein
MNSKYYACIFSALYVALLVVALLYVVFEPRPQAMQQNDVMYIEFIEPPTPPEPKVESRSKKVSTPVPNSTPKVKENPPHKTPAPEETTEQSGGKAEETKTVNQRALFQMSKVGVDKPADVGNKMAKTDTVITSTGAGQGLSQYGEVGVTDKGLAGRGCDLLPPPVYPGNKAGKVVVEVIVNPDGKVTSANVVAGTTTSDSELKNAAVKAARKARFRKSDDLSDQKGTITYIFKLR